MKHTKAWLTFFFLTFSMVLYSASTLYTLPAHLKQQTVDENRQAKGYFEKQFLKKIKQKQKKLQKLALSKKIHKILEQPNTRSVQKTAHKALKTLFKSTIKNQQNESFALFSAHGKILFRSDRPNEANPQHPLSKVIRNSGAKSHSGVIQLGKWPFLYTSYPIRSKGRKIGLLVFSKMLTPNFLQKLLGEQGRNGGKLVVFNSKNLLSFNKKSEKEKAFRSWLLTSYNKVWKRFTGSKSDPKLDFEQNKTDFAIFVSKFPVQKHLSKLGYLLLVKKSNSFRKTALQPSYILGSLFFFFLLSFFMLHKHTQQQDKELKQLYKIIRKISQNPRYEPSDQEFPKPYKELGEAVLLMRQRYAEGTQSSVENPDLENHFDFIEEVEEETFVKSYSSSQSETVEPTAPPTKKNLPTNDPLMEQNQSTPKKNPIKTQLSEREPQFSPEKKIGQFKPAKKSEILFQEYPDSLASQRPTTPAPRRTKTPIQPLQRTPSGTVKQPGYIRPAASPSSMLGEKIPITLSKRSRVGSESIGDEIEAVFSKIKEPTRAETKAILSPEAVAHRENKSKEDQTLQSNEQGSFEFVFQDYLQLRKACGESTQNINLEVFSKQLLNQRRTILKQFECSDVHFEVYTKNGHAAIKATPLIQDQPF